jgi:MFS family permease
MIRQLRQVLLISFSAFFADLGYQAAVSIFSIYLVYILHAPVYLYGLAEGLNYGLGSVFGYVGGKMADHYGAKLMSIVGNALIPLMSFFFFTTNPVLVVVLFSLGWWMRNFRSPPRRALLSSVTTPEERQEAYGLLHALDIAGASIAVGYITVSLLLKLDLKLIMLTTVAYLAISTALLGAVRGNLARVEGRKEPLQGRNRRLISGILIATSLFGFSYFSFGYPILTVTEKFNAPYLGTLTYLIFLLVSSTSGYVFGRVKRSEVLLLTSGYVVAALASLGFQLSSDLPSFLLSSSLMGIAVGMVETFEPSIVSKVYPREGEGMGLLAAFRSLGLFTGNLAMGILFSQGLAYWYAFLVSLASVVVMVVAGRSK